jgi:hypothetical protein
MPPGEYTQKAIYWGENPDQSPWDRGEQSVHMFHELTGDDPRQQERRIVSSVAVDGVTSRVFRRKVTVGPWEEVPQA